MIRRGERVKIKGRKGEEEEEEEEKEEEKRGENMRGIIISIAKGNLKVM